MLSEAWEKQIQFLEYYNAVDLTKKKGVRGD